MGGKASGQQAPRAQQTSIEDVLKSVTRDASQGVSTKASGVKPGIGVGTPAKNPSIAERFSLFTNE